MIPITKFLLRISHFFQKVFEMLFSLNNVKIYKSKKGVGKNSTKIKRVRQQVFISSCFTPTPA
ncbi:hypothetical protein EI220_04935 [Streptococcus suis]|uniref:Uncharacterized protein n=1 Tax=Streptococcus suis TaxID=1307 RepID=A0A3R8TD02_STRSU|nr:hypothetical protein EI220_04935 [Streptococcus suis]